MQDLKDITQDIHYENFRKKKLTEGEGMSPYLGYVMYACMYVCIYAYK